ncbi:MAG: SDR family oxidoreductase [Gluconacetobacter diazotrophicus]|nr:SDR family oxidoreductase [Gluconacetobacter diazotrophicus]
MSADLSAPGLALSADTRRALAAEHDLVLHAAALTRFDADEAAYRAINVDGTARILDLAGAANAELIHVSTAYVCGTRDGTVLEVELDIDQEFSNGYERSKAAAERIVRAAIPRACIVRPSIVVGDHPSGRIRRFDTFYVVLKLLAEGRLPILPATAHATLDLVPLDHVSDAVAAVAARFEAAAGRTLHLVADRPTPVSAFPQTFARHPGLHAPELRRPAEFDPATLSPVEQRLLHRGLGVYLGYFTRAPRFDAAEARAVLGYSAPPVDQAWWDRLVRYALSAGFIRAGSGRPGRSDPVSRSVDTAVPG